MKSHLIQEIFLNKVKDQLDAFIAADDGSDLVIPFGTTCRDIKAYFSKKYPQLDLSIDSDFLDSLEVKLEEEEERFSKLSKEAHRRIKSSLVANSKDSPNISLLHTLLNKEYCFEERQDKKLIKNLLCSSEKLNFVESRSLQNTLKKITNKITMGRKIISVMGAI